MRLLPTLQQSAAHFESTNRRINIVMALLAVTVLLSLVFEYGFYVSAGTGLKIATLFCNFVNLRTMDFSVGETWEKLYIFYY